MFSSIYVIDILLISFGIFFDCYAAETARHQERYEYNEESTRDPDFIHFQHNQDFHQNFPSLQHHHHHHHHHHLHNQNKGTTESSEESFESDYQQTNKNNSLIPLDLVRKFEDFIEVNDLLSHFVEGEDEPGPFLTSRFGEDDGERTAATVPKAAACMPELQTVKIASSDDPSVLYIPSCTRIERCGGCCSHNLLSCQPKDTETLSFQVVKTQFMGGSKLKFVGKEVVLVEKHTKCKCDCRVRPEDCNRFQEYRKNECRCACTNTDEEKKCQKESPTKLWNPEACICQCREILECSTGFRYDTNVCKCMPAVVRRRYVEMPRKTIPTYRSEALPVLPLYEKK